MPIRPLVCFQVAKCKHETPFQNASDFAKYNCVIVSLCYCAAIAVFNVIGVISVHCFNGNSNSDFKAMVGVPKLTKYGLGFKLLINLRNKTIELGHSPNLFLYLISYTGCLHKVRVFFSKILFLRNLEAPNTCPIYYYITLENETLLNLLFLLFKLEMAAGSSFQKYDCHGFIIFSYHTAKV